MTSGSAARSVGPSSHSRADVLGQQRLAVWRSRSAASCSNATSSVPLRVYCTVSPLTAIACCTKRVVHPEAAAAQLAQRSGLVPLDERREHSGRRLRCALPGAADIEHADARPGSRQLVRTGTTDDAGADDDDFAGHRRRRRRGTKNEERRTKNGTLNIERRTENGTTEPGTVNRERNEPRTTNEELTRNRERGTRNAVIKKARDAALRYRVPGD